ncbi:type IV toxin-antitoxin system AbiEi family antitoxin domain-containing protein [Saccharopolyspora indica]|uniref:type IV toxin-antitoxin system AbiEi family antitoxin domain-containing protein n=1 Tax=Saccharopolyspora indica TaxID=1229659 RepID=UPI0022EB58F6|nr:type IV toxin-antitoxin system AbiEi family antitoxin domain-containing protein [Saccharopolyspora indica]MDA3645086.1 type IV toxin-antitoxin system AbiEi family antitoxin domain-containing protein [Saccharopolyspora indica]
MPLVIRESDLAEWELLNRSQHAVFTRRQLRKFGISHDAVRANVRANRWQRVHRGVIALFSGPLPRPARISAALLYADPPAVLSHQTAAQEWGWLPKDDGPIHVTVPYGTSAMAQEGVVIHRSRAFQHIVVAHDPPRTSRADTVIDMAVAEADEKAAERTLLTVAAANRVAVDDIGARLVARPAYRYRTALDRAVRLLGEGLTSMLEARYFLDVEQAHGIPRAQRQVPRSAFGRKLLEDCSYEGIGVRLIVRLDGRAYHSDAETAFRDRRRDNAAELSGMARLVYGWRDVERNPCSVAREVVAVLRREGWRGPTRRCRRCVGP